MKKKLVFCGAFLLLPFFLLFGQKYTTKTGTVKFEASVPSFEEVAGTNKSASAVLDSEKGNLAVLTLVKGFRFKVALMEEHFNENYIESDKYPKSTFSGAIEGFDLSKLTDAPKTFSLSGNLTLHGVTKKISAPVKISKSGNSILLSGSFKVKPEDFSISVPGAVSKKVAKTVSIDFSFSLTK